MSSVTLVDALIAGHNTLRRVRLADEVTDDMRRDVEAVEGILHAALAQVIGQRRTTEEIGRAWDAAPDQSTKRRRRPPPKEGELFGGPANS